MAEHKDPITPPLELVEQWANSSPLQHSDEWWAYELLIAHHAARWGADQELDACCKLLGGCTVIPVDGYANTAQNRLAAVDRVARLRAARRPKPPSLAEKGLSLIDQSAHLTPEGRVTIRRALERLQHLEQESNDN